MQFCWLLLAFGIGYGVIKIVLLKYFGISVLSNMPDLACGVIGSMNPKAGCAGSVLNLLEVEGFNHQVKTTRGVLQEECSAMLSDFFKELREKKKQRKMLAKQEIQQIQSRKQ